jgi:DNA polymerase-3 subunit gamma/tau
MDSTAIRRIWPELVRKVAERSKPTMVLLQNATVRAVEGNTVVLAMPTAGLAKQLAQESRAEVIRSTLRELVAGDWQLRCVHGDGGPPDGPGAARRPAPTTRARPVAEARVAEPPARPAPVQPPPEPVAPPQETAPPREAAPARGEPDVPPPAEPPADPMDEEVPPDPTDVAGPPVVHRDPDTVVVEMLTEHLSARRLS